jgi:hypothetical protein
LNVLESAAAKSAIALHDTAMSQRVDSVLLFDRTSLILCRLL